MEDQKHAAYRQMLLNIAESIDQCDSFLEAMKFRCDHIIKGREKEQIKSAIHLWTALEKRECLGLNNTEFLKELLRTCMSGQLDALRVVEHYENQFILATGTPENNQYRQQQQQQQQHHPIDTGHIPPQVVYIVQTNNNGNIHGQNHNQVNPQTAPTRPNQYNGPDLQREITFLSKSLGRQWRFYIRALGVSESAIEDVTCDYRTVREQIQQCFLHWMNQEQQNASRHQLIVSLKQVQRNDLASALEEGRF